MEVDKDRKLDTELKELPLKRTPQMYSSLADNPSVSRLAGSLMTKGGIGVINEYYEGYARSYNALEEGGVLPSGTENAVKFVLKEKYKVPPLVSIIKTIPGSDQYSYAKNGNQGVYVDATKVYLAAGQGTYAIIKVYNIDNGSLS